MIYGIVFPVTQLLHLSFHLENYFHSKLLKVTRVYTCIAHKYLVLLFCA